MVRPTVALILGGALNVWREIDEALTLGEYVGVISCNDMIAQWPGSLDAVVTLHPEKLIGWLSQRERRGFRAPEKIFLKPEWRERCDRQQIARVEALEPFETEYRFSGQTRSGSSGLFAAKVALEDLGFAKAVGCGVPMDAGAMHILRQRRWGGAAAMQCGWEEALPAVIDRLKSMSGWTRELLGPPSPDWMQG